MYSAYRVAHEKIVLNTSGVKGVVIHPGVVYGRQGGLTGNGSWERLRTRR